MRRSSSSVTIGAMLAGALLFGDRAALAQSGRGLMHGYVEFEDVSYNERLGGKIHATVELRALGEFHHGVYTAQTDERGSFDIAPISVGEYRLRITYAGYEPYEATIYIPSDFECRLAVLLKKAKKKQGATHERGR